MVIYMERKDEKTKKKSIKQYLANTAAYCTEKACAELALPSALLTTVHDGNYFQRMTGGIKTIATAMYDGIDALVENQGVRDLTSDAGIATLRALGNVGDNIATNPSTTLYAALATYAAMKMVPLASSKVRKMYNAKK